MSAEAGSDGFRRREPGGAATVPAHPPILHLLGFAATYFSGAWLGYWLAVTPEKGVMLWPPGGLYLAALLSNERRRWVWYLLAALPAELAASMALFGFALPGSLAIYLGNTLEALLGASLVRYWCGVPFRLNGLREVLALALLGAIPGPALSAAFGAAVIAAAGRQSFAEAWPLWWLGDSVGILIFAPLVLSALEAARKWRRLRPACGIEAAAMLATVAGVAHLVFASPFPVTSPILLAMLWAALRFEIVGAAAATAVLAIITLHYTGGGVGRFTGPPYSPEEWQWLAKLFLAVVAVLALVVAAQTRQRRLGVLALRRAHSLLEDQVRARTAELRESEARLRLALDAAYSISFEWNIPRDEVRRYVSTDPALPPTPAETPSTFEAVCRVVHPEDRERFVANVHAALERADGRYESEFRVVRPGGEIAWLFERGRVEHDNEGRPQCLIGLSQDITERKRAEVALADAHRQIQSLIDNTPALVYAFDLEERFVLANSAVAEVLNSMPGRLIGKRRHEFMPKEDADWHEGNDRRVIEMGRALEFEEFNRLKGRSITWLTTKFPLRDARGRIYAVAGISADITARKRAESELRESQRRLSASLDAMTRLQQLGLLFIHDGDEDNWEEIFNRIVDTAIAISGSDFGNVQLFDAGSEHLRIIGQQGFPDWWIEFWNTQRGLGACGEALRRGERVVVEDVEQSPIFVGTPALEIQRRAGVRAVQSTPLLSRSGKFLGMFSTHYRQPHRPDERSLEHLDLLARQVADILERKLSETALQESEHALQMAEQRLQRVLETDAVGVVFFDHGGTVIDANDVFLSMTGYSREQIAARELTWRIMTPAEYIAASEAEMHQCAETGRIGPYEKEYFLADGSRRWMLFAGRDLGDGTISEFVIDITERRVLEEALREADRRKDEFLAMLAHELRNPLAPIRNSLHVLRRTRGGDPEADKLLDMMQRQLTHLVRMVDDLLDVSRITQGRIELKKERVDAANLVRHAIDACRPLIEASRHTLDLALPPEPLWLDADPVRITQVLANLFNNAAKYMEPGGRIRVMAERRGGEAVVSVRDRGVGIPADMLPHVFELFTQIDRTIQRAQGGLGIGLALVRRLVEMHGGRVEAHSEGPGRGSEFVVCLPLAEDRPDRLSAPEAPLPARAFPCRILVVDDNRDAADSLALFLESREVQVRVAYDGPSALATLAAFTPEAILLDLGMPGMDGYETARHIRRHPAGRDVVLIALTGWGQDEDRRRTREAGFDHHRVKPVDLDDLQRLLASSAGRGTPSRGPGGDG